MKEVNLEEIATAIVVKYGYSPARINMPAIKEFGYTVAQQILELAAENAEAVEGWNTGYSGNAASVDKESILNTLNQVVK